MELLGDGCNYSSVPSLRDPIQVGVVMEVEVVVVGGGDSSSGKTSRSSERTPGFVFFNYNPA